jgi:hypothetical protein
MSTALAVPETHDLEMKVQTWPSTVRELEIKDQPSYDKGAELLKGIKALQKEVNETFDPAISQAYKAHKSILSAKHTHEQPLLQAEMILKGKILGYETEQKRKQAELQRRAEEEAKKQSEEIAFTLAKDAEDLGAPPETVEQILNTQFVQSAPVVSQIHNRAQGLSQRETYSAEVVDIVALCRAVADGRAKPELVLPNMTALNALARALKSSFDVPGCKLASGSSLNVRA